MTNRHDTTVSQVSASSTLPVPREGQQKVGELLRRILADFFTLYLKTKNFHWHMRGPHFRD